MNDPAAGENYSETLAKRMAERREQEAQAALTAAAEQLRESNAAMEDLQTQLAESEKVRKGLGKIYECNEKFHWKLADLIEPGIGGVSPLHFVEEGITKLRQQLAAANERLAIVRAKLNEATERYAAGREMFEVIFLVNCCIEDIEKTNWLPAEPQQQGGG